MKVSVILPVYNGERHIAETIESVLGQTYGDIEVIAIDDGSTDGSLAVLDRFGADLSIHTQENAGVSATRNRGAQLAAGELIAFLDQDDLWYSHKLTRQVEVFETSEDVSFVYSDFDLIDSTGRVVERCALASMKARWMRPFIGGHLHPYPSTVLMKRDLFLDAGGFDSGYVENTHEDVDLWVRLHGEVAFHFMPEALVRYRRDHRHHKRKRRSFEVEAANFQRLFGKIEARFGADPEKQEAMDRLRATFHGVKGKELAFEGRFEEARAHFREARRLDPENKRNRWRYYRTFLPGRLHRLVFGR